MKLSNPIGWCDETTNAVTGCDKVSPGCKNCYAEAGTRARVLRSQGIETWGPKGVRHPVAEFATKIRKLNRLCICDRCREVHPISAMPGMFGREHGLCTGIFRRIRLFADSNSDWLDEKWSVEMLADFLGAINDAPNIDFLLLTKRPENWYARVMEAWDTARCAMDMIARWTRSCAPTPPPNLWFGVSVENQQMANLRIPQLLKLPAAVRFVSAEPLLEQVDLHMAMPCGIYCDEQVGHVDHQMLNGLDWVIVGGESGPERRDCGVVAIEDVAAQCILARVPVYVKQDCAFKSGRQGRISNPFWHRKEFPKCSL